jgi:hypothetical protein
MHYKARNKPFYCLRSGFTRRQFRCWQFPLIQSVVARSDIAGWRGPPPISAPGFSRPSRPKLAVLILKMERFQRRLQET